MMTVDEYNNLDGIHCPHCESLNIHAYGIDQEDQIIYRDHYCKDCRRGWVEYFTVTEIQEYSVDFHGDNVTFTS